MTDLLHTTHSLVTDAKITEAPRSSSVTGYGPKIPTRYLIRYARRWRRVYSMVYGNAGSPYILVDGLTHHLDIDTEYLLTDLAEGRTCSEKIQNGTCIHSDHTR